MNNTFLSFIDYVNNLPSIFLIINVIIYVVITYIIRGK